MIYTLAFDVYGTLIDTSGVVRLLRSMVGDTAEELMHTWRGKQLEYSFRRGLMKAYVDFSICTRDALKYSCEIHNQNLTDIQYDALMEEYTVLPIFSDVASGLTTMKRMGHKLYAFSNGGSKALQKLLTTAGIIDHFEGIVSVEDIRTFKPDPLVYSYFNNSTNSTKENSWLVSSNSFDVIGAASYGMRAVWVQRDRKAVFDSWDVKPTKIIHGLDDLSSALLD